MFPWVVNFQGLTVGVARLWTLSQTYIVGYICLTENKIWVFHPRGEPAQSCFTQNTRDLVLLLFYTTASLDFGCPIFEPTTYSPRMVNNQHHAHTPDSMRCDHAYERKSYYFMRCHATCTIRATCNIYKFQIIIFPTYNFHLSRFQC